MSEDEWFYDMPADIDCEEDEDDPWDETWINRDGQAHEGDREDEY